MSAISFYQTLYRTETIFRVANESWNLVDPVADEPAEAEVVNTNSLVETTGELAAESLLVDVATPVVLPEIVIVEPVVARVVADPEPLPKPAPRPTIPSVVPPVQQVARMPLLNHKVLLLADEELDPSNLLFLEKILRAVGLNIDGVDLLNLHGVKDIDFAALVDGKKIHHFITFGVPFGRIHLDIAMDRYMPVRFFGITFLMADSLPTIEADQQLKKRLWGALQHIFPRQS